METSTIPPQPQAKVSGIFDQLGDYAQTQSKLLKYRAIQSGAEFVSSLIAKLVVVLLMFSFIIFLNIGLAFWIGDLLGHTYYGFFIMAGAYGLIGLLIHIFRNKWMKTPLNNLIVRNILK